ncbi:RNA polymerase sigma factor [Paraliomyxa miuraensis]|uniref:RNA polymerase sigma factor n=1 Tax=Paraliomyxa miuraensis TaxID=376150 RepID=UPI002258C601|nr:sigma-70 family RNA polymerase sigma factor [Paraliomyxa miuraensis]MCX4240953.1 sigma-70 family RNA polymerase sigma factor [Paraliomyxa miuraensis]
MQAQANAFERVYRRELPFVWAAARRMGVHPAALDDAVQDVFLTAYRRWGDLHYEVSPRAWLYGVTRRVAFRYRRSEARTLRRKAAVARADDARSAMPQAERDGARDVDAVLASLDPSQREVFVMADLLDMSGPEIAAELKIPLNTVYSRLRLARRQLERKALRGEVGPWAAAVRRKEQPPPEHVQRGWALLLPMLHEGPAVGLLGGASVGKWLGGLAAAAVIVGAAVVGGSIGPERIDDRAPVVSAASADSSAVGERRSGSSGDDAGERSSEPVEAMPTAPKAVASATVAVSDPMAPTPSARSVAPATRSSSEAPFGAGVARDLPAASAAASPAVEPSVDVDPPGLEAEVAALDRAAEALRSNDPARALHWLAEHERSFPHGRLVDVRKATRVRALCRLGRESEARTEAAALHREHPDSAVARRVPDSCADV